MKIKNILILVSFFINSMIENKELDKEKFIILYKDLLKIDNKFLSIFDKLVFSIVSSFKVCYISNKEICNILGCGSGSGSCVSRCIKKLKDLGFVSVYYRLIDNKRLRFIKVKKCFGGSFYKMSYDILKNNGLSYFEKVLLFIVKSFKDVCYTNYKLSCLVGCGVSTISRLLNQLKIKGLLNIDFIKENRYLKRVVCFVSNVVKKVLPMIKNNTDAFKRDVNKDKDKRKDIKENNINCYLDKDKVILNTNFVVGSLIKKFVSYDKVKKIDKDKRILELNKVLGL